MERNLALRVRSSLAGLNCREGQRGSVKVRKRAVFEGPFFLSGRVPPTTSLSHLDEEGSRRSARSSHQLCGATGDRFDHLDVEVVPLRQVVTFSSSMTASSAAASSNLLSFGEVYRFDGLPASTVPRPRLAALGAASGPPAAATSTAPVRALGLISALTGAELRRLAPSKRTAHRHLHNQSVATHDRAHLFPDERDSGLASTMSRATSSRAPSRVPTQGRRRRAPAGGFCPRAPLLPGPTSRRWSGI